MARLLLAALVSTSARAALESLGANTACRSTADTTMHCSEGPSKNCRDKYDVITQVDKATCEMVCTTLAGTCTGYEIHPSNKRCEIWKMPILASKSAVDGFECVNQTTPASGSDGQLYFYFDLMITNFNWAKFTENGTDYMSSSSMQSVIAGVQAVVKQGVAAAFAATMEPSMVSVTESMMKVNINVTEMKVNVGIIPAAADRSPLVMWAVLRRTDGDFQDGTVGIRGNLTGTLSAAMAGKDMLKPWFTDSNAPAVTLDNRMLSTTMPMETAMPTTKPDGTTMKPDGTTAKADGTTTEPTDVNAAAGFAPMGLAAAFAAVVLGL